MGPMGRSCQKPCFAASGVLESALMQSLVRRQTRRLRPAMAGLMAAIVLLLALFASSERLHLTLHHDGAHHLPCAVCSFAQGQVEMPMATVSDPVAPLSVAWTLPSDTSVPVPDADFSVASSRGPPDSVSSL